MACSHVQAEWGYVRNLCMPASLWKRIIFYWPSLVGQRGRIYILKEHTLYPDIAFFESMALKGAASDVVLSRLITLKIPLLIPKMYCQHPALFYGAVPRPGLAYACRYKFGPKADYS